MAFLFGRNRQRSALDMVRTVKDLLQKLAKEEDGGQTAKVRLPPFPPPTKSTPSLVTTRQMADYQNHGHRSRRISHEPWAK